MEVHRAGRHADSSPVAPVFTAAPPQPKLQGLAAQVAEATANAAQWHEQACRALSQFEYAAAVELFERVPSKLRNQAQWQEAIAKRDRLAELEALIGRLVNEHEFHALTSPVRLALELQPHRDDLKALLVTLPDVRLRAGTKAGERTVLDIDGLHVPFRWCPPGKFKMGIPADELASGANQVHVELTSGFWMGETVVTQQLFQAILHVNPSLFHGPSLPVETVSFYEAQAFCEAFTATLRGEGILTARSEVTLPTEAQWEYACRAGTTTTYFFENPAHLDRFAWFGGNAQKETHPVATREPDPWGLHDMLGNVGEWCTDWYQQMLVGGTNPVGPSLGSIRVNRGGSWSSSEMSCLPSRRIGSAPSVQTGVLGFRVCLSSD